MYPQIFLLTPWYFLYDFQKSYFPEQHLEPADGD